MVKPEQITKVYSLSLNKYLQHLNLNSKVERNLKILYSAPSFCTQRSDSQAWKGLI